MEEKYKVRHLQDSTYQVVIITTDIAKEEKFEEDYQTEETVHQGSLADCEAYIKLKVGGYM